MAADQVKRARANLDLAGRTVDRLRPLAAPGYVPTQQLDQAQTAQRDAATSLQQALEQWSEKLGSAEALVRAAEELATTAARVDGNLER